MRLGTEKEIGDRIRAEDRWVLSGTPSPGTAHLRAGVSAEEWIRFPLQWAIRSEVIRWPMLFCSVGRYWTLFLQRGHVVSTRKFVQQKKKTLERGTRT